MNSKYFVANKCLKEYLHDNFLHPLIFALEKLFETFFKQLKVAIDSPPTLEITNFEKPILIYLISLFLLHIIILTNGSCTCDICNSLMLR